jgi:cysteine desulfuration protein SufE
MADMDQAVSKNSAFEDIAADFEFLDEWEDRYRYIIELGRKLEPLSDAERNPDNKVSGCASQVWLATDSQTQEPGSVLRFRGDSDAMIVRGLVAIVIALFDGKPAREILSTDADTVFEGLDLRSHLTAQRSNGLRALVDRIRADATRAAGCGDAL